MEGILVRAADELQALQDERKVQSGTTRFCFSSFVCSAFMTRRVNHMTLQKVDPEKAEAIDKFLVKLRALASGNAAFTFILDDPSGNSFIENP